MMKSVIDEKLTLQERLVLQIYRYPRTSDLRREVRLSLQYAIGTGVFIALAIWRHQPLYGTVVYGIFLWWMILRLLKARKLYGVMPSIIEKYEEEINQLRLEAESEPIEGEVELDN